MSATFYHLDGAMCVPLGTLPNDVPKLNLQRLTYVCCVHGVRSRYAIDFLRGMGFKNVVQVNSGLKAVIHFFETA